MGSNKLRLFICLLAGTDSNYRREREACTARYQHVLAAYLSHRDKTDTMVVHAMCADIFHEQADGEWANTSAEQFVLPRTCQLAGAHLQPQSRLQVSSAVSICACTCSLRSLDCDSSLLSLAECLLPVPALQVKTVQRRLGLRLITTSLQCCGPLPEPPRTATQAIAEGDAMAATPQLAAEQQQAFAANAAPSSPAMQVRIDPCSKGMHLLGLAACSGHDSRSTV